MADTQTPQAVPAEPPPGDGAATSEPTSTEPTSTEPTAGQVEREFTIKAMTQRQLVVRRFLRHRGAMVGLAVFLLTLVLAYSSIGLLGLPGWWHQNYASTGLVSDGGAPTLGLWPPRIGSHPFGQDDVGRDYFALTMRGAQRSILIALVVGVVSTVIGVVAGA
ncbi:MAG TPA: hypothetical protein VMD51_04815, partial [Mycobacterium sp.]|nr:hypothetical protein [Mycobacterium sp.]